MKLAVAHRNFTNDDAGGGVLSLQVLLGGIANRIEQFDVDVYQTPPVEPTDLEYISSVEACSIREVPRFSWVNNVTANVQWQRVFGDALDPAVDAVVSQDLMLPGSIAVAEAKDLPSVAFVTSMLLTGAFELRSETTFFDQFRHLTWGQRIQYPFVRYTYQEYEKRLKEANLVVANSEFTRQVLADAFGVDATIVYPPIDIDAYDVEYDPDGAITMVNPRAKYKGPDLVLDLAERRSNEQFLLAGPLATDKLKARADSLPNVTHAEWCSDMREIYAQAKVVLVPSRIEEAFGRVAAEAMVSGIPCVVSDRGALPEVVGNTGVVVSDIESLDSWDAAIDRALAEHRPADQKRRVRERFAAETQCERFYKALSDTVHLR